jgi:hypothetical protein
MNYVAIDPSLTCTAMVVNDKKFVYTSSTVAHTKKGELKGWFSECEDLATIRVFNEIPSNLSNSDLELAKLEHYKHIVSHIMNDIMDELNTAEDTLVGIEGYSHSSNAGPLIDLVTFSTLLRQEIHIGLAFTAAMTPGYGSIRLKVYQPTEVKRFAAMLVYPPIKKGKKTEYRNNQGVAGGSFKKHEIYLALTENPKLQNDEWVKYLLENADEVHAAKSVPKPIEDINDAKTLYEILKSPTPLE